MINPHSATLFFYGGDASVNNERMSTSKPSHTSTRQLISIWFNQTNSNGFDNHLHLEVRHTEQTRFTGKSSFDET